MIQSLRSEYPAVRLSNHASVYGHERRRQSECLVEGQHIGMTSTGRQDDLTAVGSKLPDSLSVFPTHRAVGSEQCPVDVDGHQAYFF